MASAPGAPGPARGDRSRLRALTLGALGVVFGDIGTSPLYTMREIFHASGVAVDAHSVLGALSLVFWALMIVVSLKYVWIVMRADNRGEGGVLALAALAQRAAGRDRRRRRIAVALAIAGAGLFLGDGIITPAISVLSAVEGLKVATPLFAPYVVPLALVILVGLFLVQRRGTARVGRLFGPVIAVWFAVLGALGLAEIAAAPGVLRALWPGYALAFLLAHGYQALLAMGAVVLAVTGAEALYADMGHFGRRPIRLAWFGLVLPGLVLNYFGQGALLIRAPAALENPFFLLAPSWALLPLVLLATMATVIASQAVISGAFSLARQAVQLGYLPRLEIRHTSETEIGQIYVPKLNWLLMVAVVVVVLGFRSSSNLASAYGIAVTGAMTIDAMLAFMVARALWGWPPPLAAAVFAGLLAVDLTLLSATALKIPSGGWFPIVLGAAIYAAMSTWRAGRAALLRRLRAEAPPLDSFVRDIQRSAPARVPGVAVFLTGNHGVAPRALLHNMKHNHVLHECVVIVTVTTEDVPHVPAGERLEVRHLDANFHAVLVRYGFMDQPDIPRELRRCGLDARIGGGMGTSYFLSRETLIPSTRPDLPPWREHLFIALNAVALSAAEFFRLPHDRVIEIGTRVEI